ncbi:MAG: pyrroline-5-carboxylate reductase [Syntrophomonadaceae bacterium]
MEQTLGIIGCGKMAYALVKGIHSSPNLKVGGLLVNDVNPSRTALFAAEFKSTAMEQWELVKHSSAVILAVKPQQVADVLALTRDAWTDDKLLISIAAGVKTGTIEGLLEVTLPVVRIMPNTPCLVGAGVSAYCPGKHARSEDLELVEKVFSTMGLALPMEEKNMDAVTAVSGSGPAYAFLVVEAMMNAAVQVGLDINTARALVLKTIEGSIKMLEDTGEHPAILREQVCSPAGTTIAGIRQLEDKGLRAAFFNAIEAAYLRSIALGNK